jgi:hypothetical protein
MASGWDLFIFEQTFLTPLFFKQQGTVYRYVTVCQNFLILKTAAGTATGWGDLFVFKQAMLYQLFF